MPGAHAKLSPSAAARWISCPASIQMSEGVEDRESAAAREGTLAHALADIELRAALNQVDPAQYSEELDSWKAEVSAELTEEQITEVEHYAAEYVSYVVLRSEVYPDTVVFAERRVATGVPQSWGTSDAILVSPDHVEIIDLKYGKGVKVSALRNPQLRLYAAGALDEYGYLLGSPSKVYSTVYQPRLENISTEELTPDQLELWRAELAVPAAEEALGPAPRFGPSQEACFFCPAAGFCKPRAEHIAAEEFGQDPVVMTAEEMGSWLSRFKEIRDWAHAVEAEALNMLYEKGEDIPGWKSVLSGSRRKIINTDEAIERLTDLGYSESEVSSRKLAGLTALDRLTGGKDELQAALGDLMGRTPGKPSLAPAEDPRRSITQHESALEDLE